MRQTIENLTSVEVIARLHDRGLLPIATSVARRRYVTIDEICVGRRNLHAAARSEAIARIKRLTDMSNAAIGELFGITHWSVRDALKRDAEAEREHVLVVNSEAEEAPPTH